MDYGALNISNNLLLFLEIYKNLSKLNIVQDTPRLEEYHLPRHQFA